MKSKKLALLLSFLIALTPVTSFAEEVGVCSHVAKGYDEVKNYEVVENADIKWVRDECTWSSTETTKGNLTVPENVKRYYKALHESGKKVLLVLDYGANSYYTLSDGNKNTTITIPTSAETEYMSAWKNYVTTVAGELGEYVDAYEIWNEPDLAYANSLLPEDNVSVTDYDKAADAYVDLYVNTKELLDVIQPGKPVLFGTLCRGGDSDSTLAFYNEMKAVAEEKGKSFDEYVDDVSIHFYKTNVSDATLELSAWESTFDSFDYTGNVWLTETGLSETVEEDYTQEEYLPMVMLEWDRYIKENNRGGVAFWYDLRNDINSSDYESNFGLVDEDYNEKPAFDAMKARNEFVKNMPLTNYQTPETGSGLLSKSYGVLGTYSDGVNTTYVGYDVNDEGEAVEVQLSGKKAYVYDYLGNLLETIDDTTGTYDMPLDPTVTYVVCVDSSVYLNKVEYNKARTVMTVSGEVSELDVESIEISLTDKNGNKAYSETVSVVDGMFSTEFTFAKNGTYTVSAGNGVAAYCDTKEIVVSGLKENITLGDSAVSISGNKITVTGTVAGAENGETVSFLVVPAATDLENLKAENVAYIDDIEIINGAYSHTFTMPKKSEGTYKVLLSGANLSNSEVKESVAYGTASGYVNVCSFEYTPSETTTETVKVWEEVWSQNFDNLTKNDDGTYNLYGTNTSALEIDPEIYGEDNYPNTRHAYLSTRKANDYALTLTHTSKSEVSFPVGVTFDETSMYKITYDWLTNAPNEAGKKSRVRLYQETRDHYQVTKSEGKPYLTTYGWGTTSEVPAIGEWVQAEITYNSATKDVTVKWIKSDGTVILNKTGSKWDTFTNISFIELVGENGGQKIDNIVIAKEVEKEVVTVLDDTITVTAKVNNPLSVSKTCEILIIQYNEKGALLDMSVTPVTVDANVVQAIEKSATVKKASDAVTAKAFIWDSLGNMYPLVDGLPIALN